MTSLRRIVLLPCLYASALLRVPSLAADSIVPDRAVAAGGFLRYGRLTFATDPVQRLLVLGQWQPPQAGQLVQGAEGVIWQEIRGDGQGRFRHASLRGGYASIPVEVPSERVLLLEASGHSMVYVNGAPRAGDPYGYGYVALPVKLARGRNELLFACGRGELIAKLSPLRAPVMLDPRDSTLPDLVRGDKASPWASLIVINGLEQTVHDAALTAHDPRGKSVITVLPDVPPLSVRKVPFRLPPAPATAGDEKIIRLKLRVRMEGRSQITDTGEIKVRVRNPDQTHKRTFLSDIDGSVQYYAVVPPGLRRAPQRQNATQPPVRRVSGEFPATTEAAALGAGSLDNERAVYGKARQRLDNSRSGLVLTLHGAGVEAIGQAASYAPKRNLWIVAPTNRRPFGFDWEEWGRMDALEVLAQARQALRTDPYRTYLTGHSMGGHGTWHMGATFPGLFAAIGPSAGWVSFTSYGGAPRYNQASPVDQILARACSPSDTLSLITNLKPLGVYILHGDADDNVPVTEARTMAARLREFHPNVTLYEQPGAGHWWGAPSDPGTGCVDWPAMFDLFGRSVIPFTEDTRHVEFTTMNPGVSSRMRWLTILQQQRCMEPSSASVRCDPAGKRYVGTTKNVARLLLSVAPFSPGAVISIELDGWKARIPTTPEMGSICLERTRDGWQMSGLPPRTEKRPGRAGPFKEAFNCRFVLVYSTGGTPEENAWSFYRARYDSETFWYRANGSPEVIPDIAFDPRRYRDRSVVIYGSADTSRIWNTMLAGCLVRLERGRLRIGERSMEGTDLACLFSYPRPDSDTACVAVVGGTGLVGMRLTDRSPYFVSGTAFPDLLAWTPDALVSGTAGVRAAGFFGNDWSVAHGEFAFQP